MTWGLHPASDIATQRSVVRQYEAAAERADQNAIASLLDLDMTRWEQWRQTAERLRYEASREASEFPGWSIAE